MCCRCRIWLRSLFLWSFPFLWNVLCGRGQLNTLGGGVQPFGDSRSDDLRSTIPFVILESSTKKGSRTPPQHARTKRRNHEQADGKQHQPDTDTHHNRQRIPHVETGLRPRGNGNHQHHIPTQLHRTVRSLHQETRRLKTKRNAPARTDWGIGMFARTKETNGR